MGGRATFRLGLTHASAPNLVRQPEWLPLVKAEVNVSYQKVDGVDVFEKSIIIHGDMLTEEQRKKLIEISAKCPIQRTLESKITINTKG